MWTYPARIVAHRGGGSLAPENTIAALRCGLSHGFHAAEFDVMDAADGLVLKPVNAQGGRVAPRLAGGEEGETGQPADLHEQPPADQRGDERADGPLHPFEASLVDRLELPLRLRRHHPVSLLLHGGDQHPAGHGRSRRRPRHSASR